MDQGQFNALKKNLAAIKSLKVDVMHKTWPIRASRGFKAYLTTKTTFPKLWQLENLIAAKNTLAQRWQPRQASVQEKIKTLNRSDAQKALAKTKRR